jgi:hypothetical protein
VLTLHIEIYQPRSDCKFRVYFASCMGSCWSFIPVQFAEWRSRFFGVWKYCSGLRFHSNCNVSSRDGFTVSLYSSSLSLICNTNCRLVTQSLVLNIAGPQLLHHSTLNFGVCSKGKIVPGT